MTDQEQADEVELALSGQARCEHCRNPVPADEGHLWRFSDTFFYTCTSNHAVAAYKRMLNNDRT